MIAKIDNNKCSCGKTVRFLGKIAKCECGNTYKVVYSEFFIGSGLSLINPPNVEFAGGRQAVQHNESLGQKNNEQGDKP